MKVLHTEFQSPICGAQMTFQYIVGCSQYIDCSLQRLTIIKDYHMDTVIV